MHIISLDPRHPPAAPAAPQVLAAALSLEQLQELHAALVAAEGDEAVAAMEERLSADVAKVMAQ